ncbi:aldehyde ferredoxin oxidoreductase family protein [Chloroflexota bacterium]
MSFGWSGQILRVDLSKRESVTEDTEPYTRSFIGGRGINVKIVYDEVDPEVLPYDPENRLCFGPGVLGGTLAPSCSRMKVTSMSPKGLIANSGIGGSIGAAIRHAGYDNIIIQGKSDKPVYLYINDDSVEVRDASHIWGKDTWEAQQIIKGELGESVQTMGIGTGGENLVSFGSIITERQSSAGRGGMGAIMGSKKLKVIAVRGTKEVKIAKPEEFTVACEQTHEWLREHPRIELMTEGGDRGVADFYLRTGQFFLGNYEKDVNWNEQGKFGGGTEFWDQYGLHKYECFGCPVAHSTMFNVPEIGIGSADCIGWTAFGGPVWNNDRKVTFHANYLCDRYGLDSVSAGNAISFLMELYHKGIISEKDTDGIVMKRGDGKAIISTIHKIGKQEGFGKLFRDGVMGAAKIIGKGTEDCAMVVKGLEVYPQELRTYRSHALGAAIGTRDMVETFSNIVYNYPEDKEEMGKWAKELYESEAAAFPLSYEKKPLLIWDHGNRICAIDMLGVCRYITPWSITPYLEKWVKLFSLATGRDTTEEELLFAAQRTKVLERAFLVTKGIRRKDDTLPKRMFETPVPGGVLKGEKLDRRKFNKMIDEYYQLRGWDEDGIPEERTFKKFGLSSEWKVFKKKLGKEGELSYATDKPSQS